MTVNAGLYALTILIWGSSWIAITFQVEAISPGQSVFYRFAIAALLTLAGLKLAGQLPRLTRLSHQLCAMMGLLMFAVNYIFVYEAVNNGLSSGLAAVIFSLLMVMNALNGAIFNREAPPSGFYLAAALGLIGIGFLFAEDMLTFTRGEASPLGVILCIGAVYAASLGNMISARLQKARVNVLVANGWAMGYAAVGLLIYNLISGGAFRFSLEAPFLISLLTLVLLSSIVGFWCYLTLLGRIGAAKAAYAFVVFPIVALVISSLWEGFLWTWPHIIGVALILAGNLAFLLKRPQASIRADS